MVVGPAGPMDLKDLSCHLGTYYRNLEPAALSFFQLGFPLPSAFVSQFEHLFRLRTLVATGTKFAIIVLILRFSAKETNNR